MANTKVTRLKEITAQEVSLYQEKNLRYGDSFSKTMSDHGPVALIIRLEDKLSRLKSLLLNGVDGTADESVVDTLMDLATYSHMGIIELTAESATPAPAEPVKKKRKKKTEAAGEAPQPKKTSAKAFKVTESSEPPAPATADKAEPAEDKPKSPLDDLTKAQLAAIVESLGGEVPKKANREKLMSLVNEFPKAKVAVAITSLKSKEDKPVEEVTGDAQE